jgi:hypothetical protein
MNCYYLIVVNYSIIFSAFSALSAVDIIFVKIDNHR